MPTMNDAKRDFIQLPHTADIKVRVFGATKEELFAHALEAMFQVIHPLVPGSRIENDRVIPPNLPIKRTVEIDSIDDANLLVDFLSEALCLSDTHNEAYFKAEINFITPTHLRATLHGAPITGFESTEIKAVTYNELNIEQTPEGWQTDIVFDI
jgi:SHS2 domain-containing protein